MWWGGMVRWLTPPDNFNYRRRRSDPVTNCAPIPSPGGAMSVLPSSSSFSSSSASLGPLRTNIIKSLVRTEAGATSSPNHVSTPSRILRNTITTLCVTRKGCVSRLSTLTRHTTEVALLFDRLGRQHAEHKAKRGQPHLTSPSPQATSAGGSTPPAGSRAST